MLKLQRISFSSHVKLVFKLFLILCCGVGIVYGSYESSQPKGQIIVTSSGQVMHKMTADRNRCSMIYNGTPHNTQGGSSPSVHNPPLEEIGLQYNCPIVFTSPAEFASDVGSILLLPLIVSIFKKNKTAQTIISIVLIASCLYLASKGIRYTYDLQLANGKWVAYDEPLDFGGNFLHSLYLVGLGGLFESFLSLYNFVSNHPVKRIKAAINSWNEKITRLAQIDEENVIQGRPRFKKM